MTTRPTMLLASFALICSTVCSTSFARDAESDAVQAPEVKPYSVWTSFGCSRSLHQAESFADVRSALDAAERLTKDKGFVFVLKGADKDWGIALDALRHVRDKRELTKLQATQYARTCRSSWSPLPSDSSVKAEGAVRVLTVYEVIPQAKLAQSGE